MEKKPYSGIAIEFIPYDDSILTGQAYSVADSGCKVGGVGFYTEDENDVPVPLGVCWYDDPGIIDFYWTGRGGSIIYQ